MYIDDLKQNVMAKNWYLSDDRFDIEKNTNYESLFALGTGYMTTRACAEEGFEDDDQSTDYNRFPVNVTLEVLPSQKSRWGTFMPVIGAPHPFLLTGIVNLPHYLGLTVTVDGEKLDMEQCTISNYCRLLDLKSATLYRTLTWQTQSGKKLELLFTRFMNPTTKFVCIQECRIRMIEGSAKIELASFVDNDVRTNGFEKYAEHAVADDGEGAVYSDITTIADTRVVTASILTTDQTGDMDVEPVARRITSKTSFTLAEDAEAVAKKVSATIADPYVAKDKLVDTAIETVHRISDTSIEEQHAEHKSIWADRWEYSDIEIDADEKNGYNSQLAMRGAIYHLHRAKSEDEERGMICPKGTVTEVYMGSTFWDMEIFIAPFYFYTNNKTARTVPMYRCRNLPAARELTKLAKYRGARFPWMSAPDGTEACPLWQYAEHQVHITADVVIGMWHYYRTTRDKDFLYDHAAEVIVETARYWTDRAQKIQGRDGWHIYGVMGPDEYKPITNNNAYTNYMARFNLRLACQVVEMMKTEAPEKYDELAKKISLRNDETDLFTEVADGLTIFKDDDRHIVWQCENFDTAFAEIDIEGLWEDKDQLFGMFVSQEKRYRSKTMKQSDVVALMAVFPDAFTLEEKIASFDYYAPFNTQESSNSMCHHQVVAANIGRKDVAYESWLESTAIDFGKLPRSSQGLHFANVGGMWQQIVFGFAGMRSILGTKTLTFDPCMPDEFKTLSFKILWKMNRIKVTLTCDTIELENLSDAEMPFIVKGKEYTLKANGTNSASF